MMQGCTSDGWQSVQSAVGAGLLAAGAALGVTPVGIALWQSGGDGFLDCLLRQWPNGVVSQDQLISADYDFAPSRLTCIWQEETSGSATVQQVHGLALGVDVAAPLLIMAGLVVLATALWHRIRR